MNNIKISKTNITIDGKAYTSDNIPPEFADLIRDADNDGIPDHFEQLIESGSGKTTININGQKYDSWDQVPQEFHKFKGMLKDKEVFDEEVNQQNTRVISLSTQEQPNQPTPPVYKYVRIAIAAIGIGYLIYVLTT